MVLKDIRCLIFAVFFLSIPLLNLISSEPQFYSEEDSQELIEEILSLMTDEEKIGQILMLGYMGDRPSDEIMKWVRDRGIGGIKIFGWNANDLSNLTYTISAMQEAAVANRFSIPLLIATDQEGGWVRHVRGNTSITPGNMALGASDYLYDAWKTGYYIGLELKTLGINMNFAPVVDVYLNPEADVIGPRAFSSDPVKTGIMGLSFYKGMDMAGVISTAKHFPGHGDTDKDSHGTLPRIDISLNQLMDVDLIPYKILIGDDVPSIMVGHLAFPLITEDSRPASLSKFFITDLLRDRLNYKGLIISDDLFMHGARSDGLPLPDVCEQGIRAGLDLLLVSRNPMEHEKIWNHLLNLIKADEGFADSVNRSVRQVLKTKMKYLKGPGAVPINPSDRGNPDDHLPAPGAADFFLQQALRSVSILKNLSLPLPEDSRYLLAGSFSSFFYEGRNRFNKSDFHRFSYNPDYREIVETAETISNWSSSYDYIIFNLHNQDSLQILKRLEHLKEKIIVFSVLTPVYLAEVPWVQNSIAVYGTGDESFRAGYAVLSGDYNPDSIVPVSMEGLTE
ncbi:glycoside hydrolase family 3 protein [Spirochaeta isovalerica]|uniref:beta-N-acetylhexosaminidase n=1 Tax=Spirochaeta isovalerica TaxID=150 RepID=A0A841R889_9SPIO|nr:glycoside hydrolase family 3 protein [Spirochaeta isovalerica]MBB6478682.1 beta-N-acetylhexosaminidase [Spirochaeta isovalerica]